MSYLLNCKYYMVHILQYNKYIECYLSPDEYDQLNGAKLVKLNNDLYYVAAIEGYDPLGRNKTKLRLIRKM